MGALDTHCTVNGVMMKTEIGMCVAIDTDAGMSTDDDGGASTDTDGGDNGTTPMADCAGKQSGGGDFGPTQCNSAGDDDDCKYHISWTSSAIRKDTDVTFNVTATQLFDNAPATNADIQIEAFLTDTHPTPSLNIGNTESPAGSGKYSVGPVRFDASGMWTVRFHLHENCSDVPEDSPHGHAAFYVSVP
jgi:hypothetical protein